MKRLTALLAAVLLTLSVAGCGGSEASSASSAPAQSSSQASSEAAATEGSSSEAAAAEKLVVAASPSPHAEILESVKEQLAAKGIELEIKEFTDYVLPNNAVDSGEVDANYFQHQPYLTDFNAKNGTDLVSAGSIHFEPLGIYAGKVSSLEELQDGDSIAVPNDTTNEARALNLLAAQGLITLKEGVGLEATPMDIVDNPKNLKFLELAAEQVPNAVTEVAVAVINGNYAIPAGLSDKIIVSEDPQSEAAQTFANIVAIRPEDAEDSRILALIEALTSEETRQFITEKYSGSVVPVF